MRPRYHQFHLRNLRESGHPTYAEAPVAPRISLSARPHPPRPRPAGRPPRPRRRPHHRRLLAPHLLVRQDWWQRRRHQGPRRRNRHPRRHPRLGLRPSHLGHHRFALKVPPARARSPHVLGRQPRALRRSAHWRLLWHRLRVRRHPRRPHRPGLPLLAVPPPQRPRPRPLLLLRNALLQRSPHHPHQRRRPGGLKLLLPHRLPDLRRHQTDR